ncbi:MAG: FAD-dependent oxidoreductase [Bacteroides sp.]|nr:FAD-dependent oxidoreductase [Bacteroides sp.]
MKSLFGKALLFLFLLGAVSCTQNDTHHVDVLIMGGGASGITAGIQSARMGVNTLIVEETPWLGGMLTAAGVSAVDGNYKLPGGLWGEFKERLTRHYGSSEALMTGWVSNVLFEPSVGNRIFHEMAEAEKNLTVWKENTWHQIEKKGNQWIVTVEDKNGVVRQVQATVLIDATELGDVAKACGATYDVGMESRYDTGEDIAPEKANTIVQDITYVAILKDYGKDVTIPCPEGYRAEEFACACANPWCIAPREPDRVWSQHEMITYGKLPHDKYMINWPIEGNDYYVNLVEMSREERAEALEKAKQHTLCFLYFIQNELGYHTLGLADDEYPTADLLPLIPYHRESRRIHGVVRFTLNHVSDPYNQPGKLYRTGIAVGDYPVDHHHTRYQGYEDLPDLYFHPVPSYSLPLGALIPQDVDGLVVAEKSVSVSNIINGCTRLQPVVLQIGQAAGTLAALAVKQEKEVRNVAVRDVQNVILDAGGYLLPYLDVEVGTPLFKPYQRIGSTGILKGVGKNVDWENETWLRAHDPLVISELEGIDEMYPGAMALWGKKEGNVTLKEALEWVGKVAMLAYGEDKTISSEEVRQLWQQHGWSQPDLNKKVTRGEIALLLDQVMDPFNRISVDIQGNIH